MADPYATDDPYAPRARASRPWRNALLIGLVAFVAGAALVTWALTRWQPARDLLVPPEPRVVAPLGATSNPALPAPVAITAPAADSPAVAEQRVSGIEARIATIDVQTAAAAANAARAEGLLIAFAARRAIDRGTPLGYLEGQLRSRFGDTQPRAVAAIIAAGQRPVTVEGLRQQLNALEPGLAGGGASENWSNAARRTISTLFVVRRANEPSPLADSRLDRARRALDGGQVADALAEVARLPSAAVASDWMAAAGRWVDAHRALDIIETAAVTTPTPATLPIEPPSTEKVTP